MKLQNYSVIKQNKLWHTYYIMWCH